MSTPFAAGKMLAEPGSAVKAAEAAAMAARRHGVSLSHLAADDIARTVLEYADSEYRVRMEAHQDMWPSYRDDALRRLRMRIAVECMEREWLMVAKPREVVTWADRGKPWENVIVELVVPVRRAVR